MDTPTDLLDLGQAFVADGDSSFMSEGTCAQIDPELFFPEKGGTTKPAKEICLGCPVRTQCLEWALANNETSGIWGGHSALERRRIKAQRAAERQGSAA